MTKTLEALDRFAQTLPQTTPQIPDLPGPAPSAGPAPTLAAAAGANGPGSSGAGEHPAPLPPSQAAFRWSELLRAAPQELTAPAEAEDAGQPADAGVSYAVQSAVRSGEIAATGGTPPAAARSEGTTRRGARGDWDRLAGMVGLVVLAVTVGIGCRFLVQASARAGEARWRQGVGRSLTRSHTPAARNHSSAGL